MTGKSNKIIIWSIVLGIIILLLIVYRAFDPQDNSYFPKCLFKLATGYDCPGCGSQRAIHHLMNLNIVEALKANAILVISIPYLIAGYVFELIKNPGAKTVKWRNTLYGEKAIYVILIIIIAFSVLRNFTFFKEFVN